MFITVAQTMQVEAVDRGLAGGSEGRRRVEIL
jgi:hypothetical protein